MSTNINVDVTLQRLQKVSNETRELNRTEKKEREDDLALQAQADALSGNREQSSVSLDGVVESLGQPLDRTGQTPAERQKAKDGDRSSVPDTYKKLDPGAGFFRSFRPVHGWLIQQAAFSGERTLYPADGAQSASWNLDIVFQASDFLSAKWPPPDISSTLLTSGQQNYNSAGTQGKVVLPLGGQSFIYAEFARRRAYGAKYYQIQNTVDDTMSAPVVESRDKTALLTKCFLVGISKVKEIDLPSALLAEMDRIWPMPATSIRKLPLEVGPIGGGQIVEIDWRLDFTPVFSSIGNQSASPLFGHYLDWGNKNFTVGTPAIYWYLRNYSDTQANWFASQLTPEVIRGLYPSANYGKNPGNRWYVPFEVLDQNASGNTLGYRIDWYRQNIYNDSSAQQIKRIVNYGPFSRARFKQPSGSGFRFPLYAWDANASGYCSGQLLALGFKQSDLTFSSP